MQLLTVFLYTIDFLRHFCIILDLSVVVEIFYGGVYACGTFAQ